jgi:uncharacterized membrane protein YbhN (UPF0104 family)
MSMDKKRKANVILWSVVTVAVCAAVALKVDWAAFSAAAGQIRLPNVLLAFAFLFAGKFVYAAKWKAVCPPFRYWTLLNVVLGSSPLFLLPAGGFFSDAYRIATLHKRGGEFAAATSVLLDRLTMPLSIICVWLPLMAVFDDAGYPAVVYVLLALLALVLILFVFAFLNSRVRGRILAFSSRHAKSKLGKRIDGGLQKASAAVDAMQIGPVRVLLSVLFGLLGDLTTAGVYFAIGSMLGVNLPLLKWVFVYALPLIATTAIPTVGGLGVRDGTVIAFLAAYGVSTGVALTVSLFYTGAVTVCALVSWLLHLSFKNRVI